MSYKSVVFAAIAAASFSMFFALSGAAEATSIASPPTCTIAISPATIFSGDSAMLTWAAYNSNIAAINQGIGLVSSSGSQTISNITSSKTYEMTVSGQGGSATCYASVGVLPRESQLPSCSISASPSYLTNGNSTTLTWNSVNAQNASINNGVGITSIRGSQTVFPAQGITTYILTVNGVGGSQTCSTTVNTDYNYNNYNQQPYCTISVSPSYLQMGGNATLTWNSYGNGVMGPWIDNGVGSVGLSGSRVVNAYQNTMYRMTVSNQQGYTNTCSAMLNIGSVYYNQTTYYPQVALTNIPYTGTEDTLYMVVMFGITIAVWGVVAYLLYFRRDWVMSLIRT